MIKWPWKRKRFTRDFTNRIPFESCRPVAPQVSAELSERVMVPRIERMLKRLQSGNLDAANKNILDTLIFNEAFVSVPRQMNQHLDRIESIRRLDARFHTDSQQIERTILEREKSLGKFRKEYEAYCKQYADCSDNAPDDFND